MDTEVIDLALFKDKISWSVDNLRKDANGWVAKVIGILLSGMAGAQGAPYWFDLMKKLLNRSK